MPAPARAASSSSPLENLPLVILDSICEYLATCDSRRRSLFAFSMANKRCCAIVDRERFEPIRLAVEDGQQLERILARWNDILRVGERTSFVRSVKVTGRIRVYGEDPAQALRAQQFLEGTDLDDEDCDVDEDPFSRPTSLSRFVGSDPVCTAETKATSNQLWRPLAHFLSKCLVLKHFIWASTDQVPRCILDVLHNQLPNSRLHINTFSLRSLYQWKDQLHDVDVDEYALATSPCLSSICVASTNFDSEGRMDYNEEAVLQMVLGSAPNLRSVYICYHSAGSSIGLQDAIHSARPPWRGFIAAKEDGSHKPQGHLRILALRGEGSIFLQRFQSWSHHTDFSTLRSLDLRVRVELSILQDLVNMAEVGVFKCLRILSLSILGPHQDQDMATNFLSALGPLETLCIQGGINEAIMSSILDRHGASLKRLLLSSRLPDRDIKDLCKVCPNLRDLQFSVKRRQGDEQEVRLYQALGSFPRLEQLTLLLDCEDSKISEAYNEEGELELQAQRMRSALINSAIDANLARSIFLAILAANRAVRPEIAPSFRYLKLHCFCGENGYFEQLQQWVGRSWVCERERADMCSEEAIVREIQVSKRLMAMENLRQVVEEDFVWCDDGELYKPAWEEIWPESKGKSNWMEEWHSFPLYSSSLIKGH